MSDKFKCSLNKILFDRIFNKKKVVIYLAIIFKRIETDYKKNYLFKHHYKYQI